MSWIEITSLDTSCLRKLCVTMSLCIFSLDSFPWMSSSLNARNFRDCSLWRCGNCENDLTWQMTKCRCAWEWVEPKPLLSRSKSLMSVTLKEGGAGREWRLQWRKAWKCSLRQIKIFWELCEEEIGENMLQLCCNSKKRMVAAVALLAGSYLFI